MCRAALAEDFVELYERHYRESGLAIRSWDSRRPNLPALPGLSPRQDTHDQRAGEFIQGGEEEDEGGGVFPNETSAQTLATEIVLRSSEEWALIR